MSIALIPLLVCDAFAKRYGAGRTREDFADIRVCIVFFKHGRGIINSLVQCT